MLDAGFVPAVLEGFEGTLDEVVGRVASPELSANPDQCAQSFDRTAASRELIWSADGGAPNRANTGRQAIYHGFEEHNAKQRQYQVRVGRVRE